MVIKKPTVAEKKEWNTKIKRKANLLEQSMAWLSRLEKMKALTWHDRVRAARVRCYIELALIEVYSMQYPSSREFPGYLRDEFEWAANILSDNRHS